MIAEGPQPIMEVLMTLPVWAILIFLGGREYLIHRSHKQNGGPPEKILSEIRDCARDSQKTGEDSLTLQRTDHDLLVKQDVRLESLVKASTDQTERCRKHQLLVTKER